MDGRRCQQCGKSLNNRHKNSRYCSEACHRAFHDHHERHCKCCHKRFQTSSDQHDYCSPDCALEGRRARKRAWMTHHTPRVFDPLQTRVCKNKTCQRTFQPAVSNQIYCSKDCHPSAREYGLRAALRRRGM